MTKRKNTGFGMVEILIAVAIFSILMLPIISGIISSIKLSSGSKELQYRNEYAENLMEHVKTVSLEDVTDETYYMDMGTLSGTFNKSFSPSELTTPSGDKITCGKYVITGQTELGTKSETYTYRIEMDNTYYANKAVNDSSFIDPNNLSLGIVEDIDYNKVALIDGTALNYDTVAADTFKSKKLMALKKKDLNLYEQLIQNENEPTTLNSVVNRLITVEVSGDSTSGYTVRCLFDYIDSHDYIKDDNHIQYVPYSKTFKDELPNIYLMYDAYFYGSDYSANDYISVDLTGLTLEADEDDVNLFIVQTAETYSANIVDSGALDESEKGKSLIHTDYSDAGSRDKTVVHLTSSVAENGSNSQIFNRLNVYYNFGDNLDSEGNAKANAKTASGNVWYTDDKTTIDSKLSEFEDILNQSLSLGNKKKFVELANASKYVGLLNTAKEESRSLYEVKVWIQKGDTVDTTQDPILQGTKGGNET